MAQEWYYAQGDQKVGPVSAAELKRAAADGHLLPTDLVWTDGMTDWKEAKVVKGLAGVWAASPAGGSAAPQTGPARRAIPSAEIVTEEPLAGAASHPAVAAASVGQRAWLIGACLVLFFPVGLILVWRHPRMTTSTKWVITGVVAVLGLAMIGASQQTQKDVAAADRLWADGDKKAAADKYRTLLDGGYSFLTDEQKPLVYGRLIDHDAESGNVGSAVKLAEQALQRGVEPSATHPAGQAAVAEAKRKRPAPSAGVNRPKKSDYTLRELRDMFPIPGTTPTDVYDTLGTPDLHDPAGFRLHYGYKKFAGGKGVMFTFEDGTLVGLGTMSD